MATIEQIKAELARRAAGSAPATAASAPNNIDAVRQELAKRFGPTAKSPSSEVRTGSMIARGVTTGAPKAVLGMPALISDALEGYSNLVNKYITNPAMAGIESVTGAQMPRANISSGWSTSKLLAGGSEALANDVGLPTPQNPAEARIAKYVDIGTSAIGPGGWGRVLQRAPSAAVSQAGARLAATPIQDVASSLTGAAAADYVKSQGASENQQLAAGLLGGLAPSVLGGAVAAVPATVRGVVRGPSAVQMQKNIQTLTEAGVPVSAATASPSRAAATIEGGLGNLPTSRGIIRTQREAESAALKSQVDEITNKLAPLNVNEEVAGKTITDSILKQYIPKAKGISNKLYNRVDALVNPNSRIKLSEFTTALDDMTSGIAGAPNVSKQLTNPWLVQLKKNIERDLGTPLNKVTSVNAPYELVSKLRSSLGAQLSDAGIASDIPRGELKKLYGALMGDIQSSISGIKGASDALSEANAFTRMYHQKVDDILQPILDKRTPEAAFSAVMQNTQTGGTVLKNIMDSLRGPQRRIVSATVIDKLGKARPGVQDMSGEVFSPETFMTNWNKLSKTAKEQITNQLSPELKSKFDTIGQAMELIRNTNAAMPNMSGTAANSSFANIIQGAAGAGTGLLVGGLNALPVLGGVTASVAIPNVTARMMTSPKFVNWLAQQTKVPSYALGGQLNLLQKMNATEDDDSLKSDIDSFINGIGTK